MKSPRLFLSLPIFLVIGFSGCLPDAGSNVERIDEPYSYKDANKLFSKMRRIHGARYVIDHEYNGKPFQANWELGKLLEKKAQVQLKPKMADFDEVELCMALEKAVSDSNSSPWHPVAVDTILRCYRSAQPEGTGVGVPHNAPYEISVQVKRNGDTWFCMVRIQNMIDPEKIPGNPFN